MSSKGVEGWIGVDFDGTLATYDHWTAADDLGEPVERTVSLVKGWLLKGIEVRIFTARVWHDGTSARMLDAAKAMGAIEKWCLKHIGLVLKVTNVKDYNMWRLYDDRAVQVERNTGRLIEEEGQKA